jgi:hypothetical protein
MSLPLLHQHPLTHNPPEIEPRGLRFLIDIAIRQYMSNSLPIHRAQPIFREESLVFVGAKLRDVWMNECSKKDSDKTSEGEIEGKTQIEVLKWLSRMTLDVIGLAGASLVSFY